MAKSKKKASRVYRPCSFFDNKTKVKVLTANVRKSTLPKAKNFSKIVGLKTLQIICPKLGLKVLPFHIVKLSQPLNLKAIGLGTKYRRVLVRSDPKSEISKIEWNDCPRAIFSLKGKSVKALERDIRQWIKGVRAERRRLHKKPASFIIHPLRPKSSYELVGRVFLNPSTIGGLGVNFGKPKETAIASSFRDSAGSTRELFYEDGRVFGPEQKISNAGRQIQSQALSLGKSIISGYGFVPFDASFVKYKDRKTLEFYDLLFGRSF